MSDDATTVLAYPPAGTLEGAVERGIATFKGIPYAEPPIGPRRWKPPVQLQSWTGVRKADRFGDGSIQPLEAFGIYPGPPEALSEDCLTLNVWGPADARKAPVFLWIHGGGFASGCGHDPMYDGSALAAAGVVFVSINYRLGALGFMAHPELSEESPDGVSGNYGLLDQIAALHWVRDNIAAFGGDPDNVTIAGESAGAISVLYLMVSPLARGLFHKAIAQSGNMLTVPSLRGGRTGETAAETTGLRVAEALGAADIAALRAVDPVRVCQGAAEAGFLAWPIVDGVVAPRQLVDGFARGEQARVPIIAGFTSGEGRSLGLVSAAAVSAADYEAASRARHGDLAEDVLRLYPATDLEESLSATARDALFGWGTEHTVRCQAGLGEPAYSYYFDHAYPAADAARLHGFHGAEIPYVLGTLNTTPPRWPMIPDTENERALSAAMIEYWASFAKTGVPSAEGQVEWRPYNKGGAYLHVTDRPRASERLLPGMYDLHLKIEHRRQAAGNELEQWNSITGAGTGSHDLRKPTDSDSFSIAS